MWTTLNGLKCVDLRAALGTEIDRMPVVLRLLAENHLRVTAGTASEMLAAALFGRKNGGSRAFELTFRPNRMMMHDTTCTPAIADIAALRDTLAENGADPSVLAPSLPVEVSVDHSLSVDHYAAPDAFRKNAKAEIGRNMERYAFMKWASNVMPTLNVNPPGTGIMHTINIEQLATVLVVEETEDGTCLAHPDMMLGTDSHTPMVNGLGVMAWGIGGLEAESIMFGEPVTLALPKVVGVRLLGRLSEGVLSTDLALKVTEALRKLNVVGAFVEFFGPGVAALTCDDRAVVSNMAPEYGATTGYFPVDAEVIAYLERTGRRRELIELIEPVFRKMDLWFDPGAHPEYDAEITIDLAALKPSLAGPRRPQDVVGTKNARAEVEKAIGRSLSGNEDGIPDGAVGIAAITSCTNTSDPRLMLAAGLLARKARERGLGRKPWVKTSLGPGSPSAGRYLERTGLIDDLSAMGFDIVGYGCTTCIGNSGPLPDDIQSALAEGRAVVAVLSGNRNFPGRVHPQLDLGFLASPPLVVAYALRGDILGDILSDPIGEDGNGKPVFLSEIWPSPSEVEAVMRAGFRTEDVASAFAEARQSAVWKGLDAADSQQFPWDAASRYLRRPAFVSCEQTSRLGSYSAAPLLVLGDDMTTDHISPAGPIAAASPAGRWLVERGADPHDLNVYAAYRGNWEVMLRGLFQNKLARNYLGDGIPQGETLIDDEDTSLPLHLAAEVMRLRGQSVVIIAGERYGMGSSRDWAAKGVALLHARAVIARSFERIHRTNLIGMGIAPILIEDGFVSKDAGIRPADRIEISIEPETLALNQPLTLRLIRPDGAAEPIMARLAAETDQELNQLRLGGVLTAILKKHCACAR